MASDKTWRNRIKNCNNEIMKNLTIIERQQVEYGKCLCPSCYVLHCENRKKPKDAGVLPKERHFDLIDSF